MREFSWVVCECDARPCTCYDPPDWSRTADLAEAEQLRGELVESLPFAMAWLENHAHELTETLSRPTDDLIREALEARRAPSVLEEPMPDPTPAPEIFDGVDQPLTNEQMSDARRVVLRLLSSADREHYNTGNRWRDRCACGDRWPCPTQDSAVEAAGLMEAVVSELMVRRRYARPLTGLDKVQDAVRAARGGEAPRPFQGFA